MRIYICTLACRAYEPWGYRAYEPKSPSVTGDFGNPVDHQNIDNYTITICDDCAAPKHRYFDYYDSR